MSPADTTRCWLLSEKTVALVNMGRMADAVSVAPNSNGVLGILEIKAHLLGTQGRYKEQLALTDSLIAWGEANQAMPMDKMLHMKARCLEKMGRKDEALSLMEESYLMLDSVKQSDIDRSMSEFSVKYKTLETQMALAASERAAAQKTNLILWLVMAVVLLTGIICVILYRIMQEATANVMKHGNGEITISLMAKDAVLQMQITNDFVKPKDQRLCKVSAIKFT